MAKQVAGVSERVLACAKEEFLEKGYLDASLRTIAARAQTTTGSIYTRFHDKEGLFAAIVNPVAQEFRKRFLEVQVTFHQMDAQTQKEQVYEYSGDGMMEMLDYIYDHFDEFRILLDASYGTAYQHFVEELIRIEEYYTYRYMETIGCQSVTSGQVTREFLHMVTTAYYESLFEVVRHRMEREQARRYVRMLSRYHSAGFDTLFYPEPEEESQSKGEGPDVIGRGDAERGERRI
ncbi:MAG: TetR/AcrR family transcriptional regulator [Eubacteriales bacterium]|nr:TetR/AcrR family transcriptional regulator [Eubacteriales bacterium]